MKKNYPIMNPIEMRDYDKEESIDMAGPPAWLEEEMEKVAKIEKCDIRDLRYERELYYDKEQLGWVDSGLISWENNN